MRVRLKCVLTSSKRARNKNMLAQLVGNPFRISFAFEL